MWIGLMALLAGINRLRGWSALEDWAKQHPGMVPPPAAPRWREAADKLTGRGLCAVYAGLAVAAYAAASGYGQAQAGLAFFAAGVGFFVWALKGWGDYFDFTDAPNKEVWWIDALTEELDNGPTKDALCMALRSVHVAGLFIGLLLVFGGTFGVREAAYALLTGLAVTLLFSMGVGAIYRLCARLRRCGVDDIVYAEALTGGWMGALIVLTEAAA